MDIIRGEHSSHFTIISNDSMRDERLSFRARGIHHYLLSFPTGWKIDSTSIARAGKEGRDAIRNGLRELEAFGYIHRSQEHDASGRWTTKTTVYEVPMPENPTSDNPVVGDSGRNTNNDVKNEKKSLSVPNEQSDLATILANEWWENYKTKTGGKSPAGKRAWFALKAVITGSLSAGWSPADVGVALNACETIPSMAYFERILTRSGARRSAGEDRLHRDLEFLASVAENAGEAPMRSLEA